MEPADQRAKLAFPLTDARVGIALDDDKRPLDSRDGVGWRRRGLVQEAADHKVWKVTGSRGTGYTGNVRELSDDQIPRLKHCCETSLRTESKIMIGWRHPASLEIEELLKDCTVRTARRRGPGGQHRNKTESAVVILHEPTGVEAQAAERRSQPENRHVAVKRLRINLALEVRSAAGGESAPSDLWRSRVRDGKIVCSVEHTDFASLLAEALDVLAFRGGNLHSSAEQLQCSPSQLAKFLYHEPRAFRRFNELRRQRGLPEWNL
ncbi:MAG: peptide chain release factor-like protein [Planctomycetaceae bacterium]